MSHSNTPPLRKQAPLTTRSSSLRSVSAAEHHTAEQYSQTGRTNPQKHLPRSNIQYHRILARTSSRYQFFEKLLWKPREDASQRSSWNQMSLPIYQDILGVYDTVYIKIYWEYMIPNISRYIGNCQ